MRREWYVPPRKEEYKSSPNKLGNGKKGKEK
jgi:hypothetical protein